METRPSLRRTTPDDRHADADDRPVVAPPGGRRRGREIRDHVVDRQLDPWPVDPQPLEDLAAEPDDGDGQSSRPDLEAQDHGAVRVQVDER